jgi:hypothetical protein
MKQAVGQTQSESIHLIYLMKITHKYLADDSCDKLFIDGRQKLVRFPEKETADSVVVIFK